MNLEKSPLRHNNIEDAETSIIDLDSEEKFLYRPEFNLNEKFQKIKKAVCAITAGLALMSTAPVFAQTNIEKELTEIEKIELQIKQLNDKKNYLEEKDQKFREQLRLSEFKDYLLYFKNKDISIKIPPSKHLRCGCEEYDVYLQEKYLGFVYPEGGVNEFDKNTFIEAMEKILMENNIAHGESSAFEFTVQPNAQKTLEEWGMKIDGSKIYIPSMNQDLDLNSDGLTEKVNIIKVGDKIIVMTFNKDGSRDIAEIVNGRVTKTTKEYK